MIAKRYGLMTVGAFLMAFSVVVYFNPLELVTGCDRTGNLTGAFVSYPTVAG